jgi:glutamate synthase (NADPH/NADH) small chain
LFERAPPTGRRIAVVGAGPAGLACAHALARAGHTVTVFDAKEKPGGLNEYGIAAYKVPGFAQREVEWLLSIGGIEMRYGKALGNDIRLADLRRDHDAVFLGIGLGGVNALDLEGENFIGVRNAVDFIAELRQCADLAAIKVGRRVVVIGGGNTAIDAAVQSSKLGAESVTLAYRRGADAMSATSHEQEFAKSQGVNIVHWLQPRRFLAVSGLLSGVEFEYTQLDDAGRLLGTGDRFVLAADSVMKAIGQVLVPAPVQNGVNDVLELERGRIAVNADYQTSLSNVWAGGDCVGTRLDLTVQAVEDGKRAAAAIDRALQRSA